MGVLRSDRVSGLGGANAINGSVNFPNDGAVGTGNYLRVDGKDNSDFNLSTNDFTMEFWFNSRNVGSTLFPFAFAAPSVSASSDAGFYIRFNGGVVNAQCFEGNNTIGACSTGSVSVDTWYHVAYVRSGSTFTIYLDGTSAATASSAEAVNFDAGWNFNIGSAYTNTYHYNGYLSNLRIVNGTALYTSNFTVPNRLEAVENTVLLCCQSPGNVLQEASGKTLQTIGYSSDSESVPSTVHASRFVPDVGEDHGTTFTDNTKFDTLSYMVPPGGTTAQSNRGRGLLMGGAVSPGATNTTQIKYFDIASQGTTDEFGQITVSRRAIGSVSSSTRGCAGGGFVAPTSPAHTVSDVIDYVTIATTANATDFGNMQSTGYSYGTASNETRGLFAGGYRPNNSAVVNTIDLITIASTGNASNFGDLVVARRSFGGLASPTRGIFMGGAPSTKEEIDYVTIATAGDATDFGNLTDGRDILFGSSSSTRGVMGGGRTPSNSNIIDYITIATTGNATDFGDLLAANYYYASTSNSTRAVWLGDSGLTNTTEYVTIATTGNSIDWGDQGGTPQHAGGACSDSHGGIS